MSVSLPEISPLLAESRLNDLGPGSPNLAVRRQLQDLASSLAAKAKNRDFALACLAGLWLLHDFQDESHAISQELDTVEGSYWHGILHRREPDYWNAKYWFRRVPAHPILPPLCKEAAALTNDAGAPAGSEFLTHQKTWNAAAFVDLCEQAARGPVALGLLCRRIQRREWELLFAYCHERAF
ncbi:MAG: hypothetical protein HYX68_17195 [Planctomycetes bacterium]|nr:hypothetical protein [Planctomycetota bacterium]